MVEVVQCRATKLMVGNRIPYKEHLNKTGLMSLSSRHIYLDLIFLFKCLQSYYDLDISVTLLVSICCVTETGMHSRFRGVHYFSSLVHYVT